MPDTNQLPALLALLEDESIRTAVMNELASFGFSLEDEIEQRNILLNREQALLIRPLLAQRYREWLAREWKSLREISDDKQQLESGLALLSEFQLGRLYPAKLGRLLDDLSDEYDARYTRRDALELSEFLFQGCALHGAAHEEYYNPLNSNLVHVIERRKGIPISLACIYILVGNRLGLTIDGCNFPGHFLAVASTGRRKVIVDCFNGGTFISEESLASVNAQVTRADILKMECGAPMIIARVLRNLTNAYRQAGDENNAGAMGELLASMEPIP